MLRSRSYPCCAGCCSKENDEFCPTSGFSTLLLPLACWRQQDTYAPSELAAISASAPTRSMRLPAGIRPWAACLVLSAAAVACLIAVYASSSASGVPAHYDFNGRRTLRNEQKQHVVNLVYFNDPSIQAQLGCEKAIENDELRNYTCFYQAPSKAADKAPDAILLEAGSMCSAVYKPISVDYGRPWCVRQTRFDRALAAVHKSERLHLKGVTLITGRLSGPNPTHQLNIHFYYIYIWMKSRGIKIGDLNLIIDC